MKGIILAGGSGTRLYPSTIVTSKQLIPVYDKPLIYYPLSVLMLAGITEVLIISTPEYLPSYKKLFGNGSRIGINIDYISQPSPDGIAQAFILGADFIGNDNVSLILGDNIFYGPKFSDILNNVHLDILSKNRATIFCYYVDKPENYGVVEFDDTDNPLKIEEKPVNPKSNYAVTGLYFYPNDVVKYAKDVSPSKRGELEITSLNNIYLNQDRLNVEVLSRGFTWYDTGSHESLLEASKFLEIVELRKGLKVSCIEEIAFQKDLINKEQLLELAKPLLNSSYGKYLLKCVNKK